MPRAVELPNGRTIARFTFQEICASDSTGSPMGASDYIAISKAVRTIFLEDVPILDLSALNQVNITFLLSGRLVGRSAGRSVDSNQRIRVALEKN